MTYSSIGVIALLIHLIINYDVFFDRAPKDSKKTKKSCHRFLTAVLVFYITDILWGLLYELKMVYPVYIDTVLFFLSMALSVFYWTRYVADYLHTEGKFKEILTTVGWMFLIFEISFLTVNFFFPVCFYFDEKGEYFTAEGRYLTLMVQVVLYAVTAVYTFIVSLRITGKLKNRHRTISISGFTMAVFIVVQAIYPFLPLYSVGCLLATCLLHTFVYEDEKDEYRRELEEHIRTEKEQKEALGSATHMAYTDPLTGVKNKHAYLEAQEELDRRIKEGSLERFGIIVFDLNGLKIINDTLGHEAGDQYIKSASSLICNQFKRSPVYRIGGDEFVAILEGEDYRERQFLLKEFDLQVEHNLRNGEVVIASGLEIFNGGLDSCYSDVFEHADKKMYERKNLLKAMK